MATQDISIALQAAGACQTALAGQKVWLMPQGTIYWPEQSVLFVADVHLGKAASFRQQGQPVPVGTTTETLTRLSACLAVTRAAHLIVLGDFFHSAAIHRSAGTLNALAQWRAKHQSVLITLVRGNHDGQAGDPGKNLRVNVVSEPWQIGPFACCHEPVSPKGSQDQSAQPAFWLAGHLHPVLILKGRAGERFRLRGFVATDQGCILPAFGAFTGGHPFEPGLQDRCFVVIEQDDVGAAHTDNESRVMQIAASAFYVRARPAQRDVRSLQIAQKDQAMPS